MNLSITIVLAVIALLQFCNAAVSMDGYTKELFSLSITETKNKLYTVEGSSCTVDMQYFTGRASGLITGEISNFSSVVIKKFKDGHTESKARLIINGASVFIEDNLVGFDENQNPITKPIIVTGNNQLSYLQTADIQGIIEDKGNGNKLITYKQNPNGAKVPYPVAKRPDETKNYNKEVFVFDISVGQFASVRGAEGAGATMIGFTCSANTSYFKGKGLDTFVDTRLDFQGQPQTLSARYILEGQDGEGRKTRVYIENNGIDVNGINTEPIIITDNPKWAWIEYAPKHGTSNFGGGFKILLWTVNDPELWNNPKIPTYETPSVTTPSNPAPSNPAPVNNPPSNIVPSTNCPQKVIQLGYKCCSSTNCNVSYVDADANWAVENGQWCACLNATYSTTCPAAITSQGYKCCSACTDVYYTDKDGKWGVENDQWCGISTLC